MISITLLTIIGIIIVAALICWLIYFLVSLTVYIIQEIKHEIRKAKQTIKHSMWDLEWKWKLMKGVRK